MNLDNILGQLVQLMRSLAAPIAVLVALCWFRLEIKDVLSALAYLIRERNWKTGFAGGSLEISTSRPEVEFREQIDATVAATPNTITSQVQDLVEAKKFILRDNSGRARVEIATFEQENAYPVNSHV